MSRKVLITGGCGFVGSSLAILFKEKYPGWSIVAFDNLKRRGSELNIRRLAHHGIRFVHGDIRNREDFDEVGETDLLIEASAEPSVLAGIDSPLDYLINTNLTGTIHCLHFAGKHQADFIFLSTSRVYPFRPLNDLGFEETPTRFRLGSNPQMAGVSEAGISESFPLEGARSFYGATKLASELIIREYHELRGLRSVINRCGVITGPYQMGKVDQGVVVLWVARHFWKQELGYFGFGGTGKQVRDILHVNDLFRLIDLQVNNIQSFNGKVFNVGGGATGSLSLAELTELCREATGNRVPIRPVEEQRTADVRIYLTDNTKITNLSGWKPEISPAEIVDDILHWLRREEKDLTGILNL